VVAAFIVSTFTFWFGYYGPAVFLDILHQQRGWPVSVISSAITMHFLISAILVAHLPDAHRRFGIAIVSQVGVTALVAGMFCWSLAPSPWLLFAAAVPSGAGWAATSAAAIIAMASPWFDRRRALALGHALNGASPGGVLFAPLWVTLIAAIGFAPAVAGGRSADADAAMAVDPAISSADAGRSRVGARWRSAASGRERPGWIGGSADRPARFIVLLANWKFTTL
jgi:MFS family permease